jgi:hypothetical protein
MSNYQIIISLFLGVILQLVHWAFLSFSSNLLQRCSFSTRLRLKDALTSPPILSYPRPGCQFIVDSDAFDKAVGAVLSQVQEGTEKVIALNQHEPRNPLICLGVFGLGQS